MAEVERLEFVGAGGARLAGILHHPDTEARGSVLLAHCFTCSKDLRATSRVAGVLADRGYAVLRFDFTGLGESEGDFSSTTVETNVGDLTRAAVALIERGYGPCALAGHSLGGAAALLAAQRLKTVRSVAVIGAPSSPAHVRHLLADSEERIRNEGRAEVDLAGRRFTITSDFLDALDEHDQLQHVAHLDRPLLVVHAVHDELVPIAEAERTFAAAAQPKAFTPLLEADHLLTDPAQADAVGRIFADWFDATR